METTTTQQGSDDITFTGIDTSDPEISLEACMPEGVADPCIIVIIGASGDLTSRKIMPALFNLYINNRLPDPFVIVGCARTDFSNDTFRDSMRNALNDANIFDDSKWTDFAKLLYYRTIDYEDSGSFFDMADVLDNLDKKHGTKGNKLFYLSIPPSLYKSTAKMLGRNGLGQEDTGRSWSRIVVEKPFGRDLKTAIELDRSIHEYFKEHQIFRIDHYLAKETVQNILMFRFANAIFEPIWDRRYIDHVQIIASETLGVEHRAGYYEQAGVLRDMFQNHMMQLLALIAMEPPSVFKANQVRDEKAKVYRSLKPFPIEEQDKFISLGQYTEGVIDDKKVPAYRNEPGIDPNSTIPTFAMMKVYLDNWRWQGVPFYLTSGKRMEHKVTEVCIQFKDIPHSMFRQSLGDHIASNSLTMGIYPDEKISLTFQTKSPGTRVCLRPVTMDFHYRQNYPGPVLDAYEKVLLDCMLGDQILFWRQDSVELCWSFLTPILQKCEEWQDQEGLVLPYESGTWGPKKAEELMTQ